MATDDTHHTPKMIARGANHGGDGDEAKKPKKGWRDIAQSEEWMMRAALAKYYHDGVPSNRSTREVASELGITYHAANASLNAAFERGLIRVHVDELEEKKDVSRLEDAVRALYAQYGLRRVVLVPGKPEVAGDLRPERRRELHTQVIERMAPRIAELLDDIIGEAATAGKPFMLGVAWGRTMHKIAHYLLSTPRRIRCPDLEVVPTVGITEASNPEPIEANVVAIHFAQAWGGRSSQLPCPGFVLAEELGIVKQLHQTRRMLEKIKRVQAVITSMGPIPEHEEGADHVTITADERMNRELCLSARSKGAVGEICYSLFDRNGNEVKTMYRAIGLEFEDLRRIAADPHRQVILVAGGDRWRFEPLRAALRARLASVLVSDTVTARYLVGEL